MILMPRSPLPESRASHLQNQTLPTGQIQRGRASENLAQPVPAASSGRVSRREKRPGGDARRTRRRGRLRYS